MPAPLNLAGGAYMAWAHRKDDLSTPLAPDDWQKLRIELRSECANHPKADPLYGPARDCEHDVPLDDFDYEDDLHGWNHDDGVLLCLARVVEYACICQDGYCSQESSAREARDDLWYAVSLAKRRADRSAHLTTAVHDVWLSTTLSLEQAQDLAAECATEDEFRTRAETTLAQTGEK